MTIFGRLRKILSRGNDEPVVARPVAVVTDSTADLPPEIVEALGITVVPLQVIFGEESFRDRIDLTSEEFFRRLTGTKELPRTSQPSTGEFLQVYDALCAKTDRILSIHLSSKFSGTVQTARRAAQELIGKARVEVLDSETVSMAMGFGVIAAAEAAQAGGDLDSCAEAARTVLHQERVAIAVDTLEYLRRGGRIGRAQAFLGGLLQVKPILTIKDGEAHPLARVRTRRKALDEIVRHCLAHGRPVSQAAVMHAQSPDDARFLLDEVARRFPAATVYTGEIGPVIGVHGGPGLVGLAVVMSEEAPHEEPAS
jgi:DegV family protein with EDD domain